MIKALIIDDDAIVVRDMRFILSRYEQIYIAGNCGSIQDAKDLINSTNPDLVFLDVELKEGTAFDLLSEFPEGAFRVIFITAFDHYAIKAIKYGAFDYLLKPVNEEELNNTLKKLNDQPFLHDVQRKVAQEYLKNAQNRIVLRSQNYLQVINFDNILYCEGEGSYTHFYLLDKRKVTVSHSIAKYEELLPESWFMRTHQSYLVNHRYIDGLHRDGYLVLRDGIEIPVSARRKEFVKKIILGEAGNTNSNVA